MTESQRVAYNEYMRKRRLERELESGELPQPRKPASWLIPLYKKFDVDHTVPLPAEHLTKQQWREVREQHKDLRAWFRDQLPANTPQRQVNRMFKQFCKGQLQIK
jgi:hypothetical protein